MDPNIQPYIIRSIQKGFTDSLSLSVRVIMDGVKYNPGDDEEYIYFYITGPEMSASNGTVRSGTVSVDAVCFAPRKADVHRIDEIAGAVMAALDRKSFRVMNYPATEPEQFQSGWIRFRDAKSVRQPLSESHAYGGGNDVPMRQINVSVDGIVEFTL